MGALQIGVALGLRTRGLLSYVLRFLSQQLAFWLRAVKLERGALRFLLAATEPLPGSPMRLAVFANPRDTPPICSSLLLLAHLGPGVKPSPLQRRGKSEHGTSRDVWNSVLTEPLGAFLL